MGWLVMATGLIFLFITGDILNQQTADTTATVQQQSGELWASQMLLLANRINDVRYVSGQQNGTIPPDQLALPLTPDRRLHWQLIQGRLWVWMPDLPGLAEALRRRSRGSALTGTLKNGRFFWFSGTATGLTPPPGLPDGTVVYVN